MKNPIETLRHSTAHLLAASVKNLYPDTKLGIGPVIENGFYYDFLFDKPISSDEFSKIEDEMRRLVKEKIPFEKVETNINDGLKLSTDLKEPFKIELIEELKQQGEKKISFYKTGNFIDLCSGPHLSNTSEIKEFKVLSLAAAYWKGDEKRESLTRIYGTAWETKAQLKEYLDLIEKAKENDHRKIGKDLGIFFFSDLVGKGLPMLTAKGATIRRILERFIIDEEVKRGYQHVWTPPLARVDLYRKSGHYPYYKETMYPPMVVDDEELILRPMTCPHHFMLYKSAIHSYKELPLKFAELAPQFRYEKSGELTGLMRVRMFTLSDAHIFAREGQVKNQLKEVLDLIDFVNQQLGLVKGKDYRFRLSLGERNNSKKFYQDNQAWEKAENTLREVLKERSDTFTEEQGEAAFYGPKIDIQMKNTLGKEETAYTIQYDFVMPKRFELNFINEEGKTEELIVIHRSSLGAFERIMAFLLEHYSGKLPVWLSPVQVKIIPISDRNLDYSNEVKNYLLENSIRVELNDKTEPMQAKIRDAQLEKIPFMVIIGDKEQVQKKIAIRSLSGENLGVKKPKDLIDLIREDNTN